MASDTGRARTPAIEKRLRGLVWGATDRRVRATWRVLLAMPLLWVLTGGVLAGTVQSAVGVIPPGGSQWGGVAQSVLHGGFFLLVLGIWAHHLDRRSLSNYGVSVTRRWGMDCLAAVAAVLLGFGFWIGLGVLLGDVTVTVAPSVPKDSVLFGLVLPVIAFGLHAAVQQVVFFRVVLEAGAEGLHSRGLSATHAALAAVPVAVVLFVVMHGEMTALRALDLVVAGCIFALLSLHSGELALGIGAHFGGFYAGVVVSAVGRTTGSLPGVLGVINQYGFPKMVVAYVVLLAWIQWRHGEVSVKPEIVQWPSE